MKIETCSAKLSLVKNTGLRSARRSECQFHKSESDKTFTIFSSSHSGPGSYSYIGLCTTSDSSCDNTIPIEAWSANNGDVKAEFTTFMLTSTPAGIHVSLEGQMPFLSLNLDDSAISPQMIRYVGVQSHRGDSSGTTGYHSEWKFCFEGKAQKLKIVLTLLKE